MKRKSSPDPWKVIHDTVENLYGRIIKNVVTGLKRPELDAVLRKLFFEKLYHEYHIENASDKNVHLFEAMIDEQGRKLNYDIDAMIRKRNIVKEIAIAKNKTTRCADGVGK